MDNKKKVLIIHPEGNIYNNPNLYEIIKLLKKYYDINILISNLEINRGISEFDEYIIEYDLVFNKFKNRINNPLLYNIFFLIFQKIYIKKKYDFIIGVDRLGLIDAYYLSKNQKSSYALISYEIFFENECSKNFKKLEIIASKNIEFAIVQDKVRAKYLSQENRIDISKMLCIPVSSSNIAPYIKNDYLHNKLDIPQEKKILIFIGSITDWCCIDKILSLVDNFPSDWVLVLHDRYGDSKEKVMELLTQTKILNKIYFSNVSIDSNHEMHKILHSADLGLALYCPNYNSIYTGKNLKYIGYASGKISTYLQNGLPIITFKDTLFGEKIGRYNFGYAINQVDEIPTILEKHKLNKINSNCIKFFKVELDFNNFKMDLITTIQKIIV